MNLCVGVNWIDEVLQLNKQGISLNEGSIRDDSTPKDDQQDKEWQIERVMNITPHAYSLHQISDHQFAVQLTHIQVGYAQLQELIKEHQQMTDKLALIQQTLVNYDWYQRDSSIQANSIDSLMKKAIKYKQLKQENKKLKKLLHNQLQNTQKVREQTQKTMKVLRQEFNTLVKQMQKQNHQKVNPSFSNSQLYRQ